MNWTEETFNFKARIIIMGVVLGICYGAIIAKATYVMVIKGPEYAEKAKRQHRRVVKLIPPRGAIVDSTGHVLANSVLVSSVYAHPNQVPDAAGAARILAPILKEPEDVLLEKLAAKSRFKWLKRSLGPDQATAVKRAALPGVVVISEFARYYPEGRLAAQVLGFTDAYGKGLEGIEHKYDGQLAGDVGRFVVERDARGRSLYSDPNKMPTSSGGHRINLTLDIRIQQIVEYALDRAMEETQASTAMIAVMEVSTGKILAMAGRPTFNPNDFGKFPPFNYRNRLVTDIFEPGSTFKVFTLAALMDLGMGKLDDELFCEEGAFEVDGKIINDTSPHSWFTIEEIIVHSSNIGAAKIGLKLGRKNFEKYVKRFGFGERTGIDLMGESSGMMRPFKKISRIGLANVAFGQGIGVTGVQLLAAFNAIANKGVWVQPHVVQSMQDYNGKTVYRARPTSRRVISEQTAKDETRVLINVIHGGGTGARAAPKGYIAAGKTGTAQKVDMKDGGYFEDRYIASFMGFVPAENPAISILVVVDDPKGDPWGGKVAGPAFQVITERALPLLGVLPEDAYRPLGEIIAKLYADAEGEHQPPVEVTAPVSDETSTEAMGLNPLSSETNCEGCMPDLVGMTFREILKAAGEHGAKVEIVGSGRAIDQRPEPGMPSSEDNHWWVQLALDPY